MANSPQAKKRIRQSEKRRLHNAGLRSKLYTHIKHVRAAISAGDAEQATQDFKKAESVIDKAANKRIIHKSKATRYKKRLAQQTKKLALAAISKA